MDLIDEVKYGSLYCYSPRPTNDEGQISKNVMLYLKRDSKNSKTGKLFSEFIAETIKTNLDNYPFKNFFGEDVALVPIPKSSLMREGSLWVPDRLASAMEKQKLGRKYPCLKRIKAVAKAAGSRNEDRPKAKDHFESIECIVKFPLPSKIILIDDVITRGSTSLGCASKLRKFFPKAEILVFAIIRTISDDDDFVKIEDSSLGKIELRGEDTFRNP